MPSSLFDFLSEYGTEHHHSRWLNKDFGGVLMATITLFLIIFGEVSMIRYVILPFYNDSWWSVFHSCAFTLLVTLAVISHLRCVFTDPGVIPKNALPLEYEPGDDDVSYVVCMKCDGYKPPRAHHCSACQRCIVKQDHHCPWVNNCVGISNHKFFLLFVLYVCISSCYGASLIVRRWVWCSDWNPETSGSFRGYMDDALSMAPQHENIGKRQAWSSAECLESPMATFVLCLTFWIDKFKGEHLDQSRRDIYDNLHEVFGGERRFSLNWLIPTSVVYQSPETVLGFRILDDETFNSLTIKDVEKNSNPED